MGTWHSGPADPATILYHGLDGVFGGLQVPVGRKCSQNGNERSITGELGAQQLFEPLARADEDAVAPDIVQNHWDEGGEVGCRARQEADDADLAAQTDRVDAPQYGLATA